MKVHEEDRVYRGLAPSNIVNIQVRVETQRLVGKRANHGRTRNKHRVHTGLAHSSMENLKVRVKTKGL